MGTTQQTKIWGGITALAIIAVGFFVLRGSLGMDKSREAAFGTLDFEWGNPQEEREGVVSKAETIDGASLMRETSVYAHPLGFSFRYPKNFRVAAFPEGEGETVLIQDESRTLGFQVFTSPFDETGPLTEERIKNDLPDISMQEVKAISVTGGGNGLTFIDGGTGTREVWFVHSGYLYQISSKLNAQSLLQEVLKTWKFNL